MKRALLVSALIALTGLDVFRHNQHSYQVFKEHTKRSDHPWRGLQVSAQAQADEYHVKAAFLFNFAKFVKWPTQIFKTPADPIVICVLGHNPFGNALEEIIRGKSVSGRTFSVRAISDTQRPWSCQILFVNSSERKQSRSVIGRIKGAGVLSVGEAEGFTADGVSSRNLSVKHKLQLIIMATVSVALLASCGAILTYVEFELRDDSQHDLSTLAVVYGANATAALTLGDQRAAGELLASLATQREIALAVIYSANGVAIAHYHRSDAVNSTIPRSRSDVIWFEADRLKMFQQILLDKQPVGVIYLEAD